MRIFILILFILTVGLTVFLNYAKKFENPYKIEMYIGVRGAGKSSIATKESISYAMKGQRVYANFEVFGAYKFDPDDLGSFYIPPESLILLDEVSLVWSNRDFATFPKAVERFMRLARHHRVHIKMYSQNFDVDKKVRGLVDAIYIMVKIANVFTIAKRVKRTIVLHSAEKDENGKREGEGFVSETYAYDLPHTWRVCFIPRWVKFFNSFDAPELPKKRYSKYVFQDEAKMYRLTHYQAYKVEQIRELIRSVRSKRRVNRFAFVISFADHQFLQRDQIGMYIS